MKASLKIEQLLKKKGESLYWLQKQTKIGYTTLLRYRDGETTGIRLEHIGLLCDALDCDANALFGIKTRQ